MLEISEKGPVKYSKSSPVWHIQMSYLVQTTIQKLKAYSLLSRMTWKSRWKVQPFFFFAYEMAATIVAGLTFIFLVG